MKKIIRIIPLVLGLVAMASCDSELNETAKTSYEFTESKTTQVETKTNKTTDNKNTSTTSTGPITTNTQTTSQTTSTNQNIPTEDPYKNVNRDSFYSNGYKLATSYEDAQYRTSHGIISGTIDQSQITTKYSASKYNNYYVTDANYTYRPDGSYESYTINYTSNESTTIYYGGGYVTLNEVCAYIKAFGEVPANSMYSAKSQSQSIAKWGKYGRVNNSRFGNKEGLLPTKSSKGTTYTYIETDFGGANYNNGNSIRRDTARIVFTDNVKDIHERRVFYTDTHYKSYCEYLNFYNGFSNVFNTKNGAPSTTNITLVELKRLIGL